MENKPGSKFELDPTKRALLDTWLKERNLGSLSGRIPKHTEVSAVPLSFAQNRMWFLHQMETDSEVYSVPIAYRLHGSIDLLAMEHSINRIVVRHEILRTTFPEIDGEISQKISDSTTLRIEEIDLREEPIAVSDQTALNVIIERASERFDLIEGPLFKVHFLRLPGTDSMILFNFHHIIVDEWSVDVFLNELSQIYLEETAGVTAKLPDLPIQYSDFAVWQKQLLDGQTAERQMQYWRNNLAGVPYVLDLPLDHPRPALPTFRGEICTHRLSRDLFEALRLLSLNERTTLFTAFMAVFQVLIYRISGQDDFLIGSPIANRRQMELENLIGFFLNTLVFRAELKGAPSFREYLRRTSNNVLDAMENQDLPFERLVEELRPQRDLSRHPLFQAAMTYHHLGALQFHLGDVNAEQIQLHLGRSKFDITLFVYEVPEGVDLRLEYNQDIIDSDTAIRLLKRFDLLLESIVKDPDQRVDYYDLISDEERYQAAIEWNSTQTDYPSASVVHKLFEEQVRRVPEAIALSSDQPSELASEQKQTKVMTYRELNREANRLGSYLRALGLEQGGLVGVCMDRSPEMVIAMLGILKAGGAYVPLDPSYPTSRLDFMIQDTRINLLLSMDKWAEGISTGDARLVCIDRDSSLIEAYPGDDQGGDNLPDDLAYVMYTSGSTGIPKGIGIPHRAIVRLVCTTDYIQINPEDCIAQASNMSFDAATFEIWGALLNGASLAIAPKDVVLTPALFNRWLKERHVQILFLTTALFNQIAMLEPKAFGSLRVVLFGGEMVTPHWVKKVLDEEPPDRLLHVYGPTENTTFTTWQLVEKVDASTLTIPIGVPIANTRVYVLDRLSQLVPPGTAGELCIGGSGLAWGYLDRPELTAQFFIPDPFGGDGGRLYRTGDLVRQLADGSIEFLGRLDNQIKLRGFRVELGEIESAISEHPEVEQAIVILHKTGSGLEGDQRLAAYVVKNPKSMIASKDMRVFLKNKLPEYMIPAFFVFLDEIPINPNGKVDKSALPIPEFDAAGGESTDIEPRDELERWLSQLWADILHVNRVGIRDNFFDLGGHSLLAVRLFAFIEHALGKRFPLATLFQSPTIEGLAEVIRQERIEAGWSALVTIQSKGSRPPFYCVHNFGGEALDLAPLSHALGEDQPFYGLQALGLDGVQQPHNTIESMAAYYLDAIRHNQPKGPYYLGGFCFGGVVAYEMACQLQKIGEKAALLVLVDASAPGYAVEKGRFNFKEAGDMLANIPIWLHDFFQMHPSERKVVVRRRFKRIAKAVERTVGIEAEMTPLEIIGEHVHVMEAPKHRRHLMEIHMQAIMKYRTPIYQGRVTAIRVRGMPLFSRRAYDMGWSKVAKGGVDIRMVLGAHHNVMSAPYVHDIAAQIRECMEHTLKER